MNQDALILYMLHATEGDQAREKFLFNLPDEALTQPVCEEGVRVCPEFVKRVPDRFITPAVVNLIIEKQGLYFLKHIKSGFYNEDNIARAIEKSGDNNAYLLAKIPDLSEKLCAQACEKYGLFCLPFLPEKFVTPDICMQELQKQDSIDLETGKFLLDVASRCHDKDLCLAVLSRNPLLLKEIPYRQRTLEMNVAAVTKRDSGLSCVVKSQQTGEFWRKAVVANPNLWGNMPWEMKTADLAEDIALAVNRQNGYLAADVAEHLTEDFWRRLSATETVSPFLITRLPKELQTEELCDRVIECCPELYNRIDIRFLTEERVFKIIEKTKNGDFPQLILLDEQVLTLPALLKIIENNGKEFVKHGLSLIPEKFRNEPSVQAAINGPSVWATVLSQDTCRSVKVPEQFQNDPSFWLQAVRYDPKIFLRVPDNCISTEMIREAVSRDGTLLRRVPCEQWTEQLQLLAIQSGKFSFSDIDNRYLTPELCEKHVNEYNFKDIPDEFRTKKVVLTMLEHIDAEWSGLSYHDVLKTCYEMIPEHLKSDPDVLTAMGEKMPRYLSPQDIGNLFAVKDADPAVLHHVLEHCNYKYPFVSEKCDITVEAYFKATDNLDLIASIEPKKRMDVVKSYLERKYPQPDMQDEQSYTPSM